MKTSYGCALLFLLNYPVLEFCEYVTRSTFVKSCVVSRVVVRSRFAVDSCHRGEMMAYLSS
jgi:hypothetical protein